MIEIPADLPADVVPFAWLLGVWEGTGVIDYNAGGHHYTGEFGHQVSFSHDGLSHVNYSGDAWMGAGESRVQLVSEVGYWRLARQQTAADPGPALLPAREPAVRRTAADVEALRGDDGAFPIEVSLVHSDGISELYVGSLRGPRVDLGTDAVVRPVEAKPYTAASRMYGLVEGHLLWAWDIAAVGGHMASHASARLAKVQ